MSIPLRMLPISDPDSERLASLIDERRGLRSRLAEIEDAIDEELMVRAVREAPTPPSRAQPLIVDRREAARRLGGISVRTVIRMEDRGELDRVAIGERRYITLQSIERRALTPAIVGSTGHQGRE